MEGKICLNNFKKLIVIGKWLHGGEVVKVGTMDVRTGKRPTPADMIPAYGKYKKM